MVEWPPTLLVEDHPPRSLGEARNSRHGRSSWPAWTSAAVGNLRVAAGVPGIWDL